MITTKQQLKEFILQDSKANGRKSPRAKFLYDYRWKFQLAMRKYEYYSNTVRKNPLYTIPFLFYRFRFFNLSLKLGFTIPIRNIDKGFSIAHNGTIVINENSKIGMNCRIHECVNIGATNGSSKAPVIGNNVFIGTGVKIIGDVTVADGVCLGANAVVVKSITEPNTTWGGIPARKVSDNSSRSNLSPMLFE